MYHMATEALTIFMHNAHQSQAEYRNKFKRAVNQVDATLCGSNPSVGTCNR